MHAFLYPMLYVFLLKQAELAESEFAEITAFDPSLIRFPTLLPKFLVLTLPLHYSPFTIH